MYHPIPSDLISSHLILLVTHTHNRSHRRHHSLLSPPFSFIYTSIIPLSLPFPLSLPLLFPVTHNHFPLDLPVPLSLPLFPSPSISHSPSISGCASKTSPVPVRYVLQCLGVSVPLGETEVHTVHIRSLVPDTDHEVCLG